MEYLKYFDFFDTKFHFYIGGHPTNTIIFGGIMSIIFCISSILMVIILSWSDFKKENPITSKSEIPGGEMRVVNLHNSKVWVPWRMVTYEEKFIDHRGILHPVVSFIEGKWNSSFGMDLTYHTIEYKLCNETSMANKTEEYKIDIPLDEIFCIDNDDFPWGGSWHGDILYYFEVNLYSCEDGIDFNASDPRCTKMSELLKHRNTSWLFEFYYPVVQFEPSNHQNPISVIYRSYFYRLSTYANKVERLYIQENIMEDDQSLFASNPKFNSYWGITNIYGDSYFTPEEKDPLVKSVSSRLYSLVVYMDQGYIHYTRKYKNVFYIISEILPLINVLLIVLKKFTHFIKLTIARRNISELIFENIHPNISEKSNLGINLFNNHKKAYEVKPKVKVRPTNNFLSIKKNVPENIHSSISNLKIDSIKYSSKNIPIMREKNSKLKLILNKNGNETNESNFGDINIIKFLNNNQLKRKTVNEQIRQNYLIENNSNIKSSTSLKYFDENKNIPKKELFPIFYYYMNLLFDKLIKPRSFFCLDKRYFIMYNFMIKIYDVTSHIRLLKYFITFIDFFFVE